MKMSLVFLWAILATLLFVAKPHSSAQAGIMVDGREPTYETLAQSTQFDSIGRFVEGARISGTLIAPDWVLTVGHVGTVSNFQIRGTGTMYGIAEIIRHPSFVSVGLGSDLALIRLNTAVVGVTPASIYRGINEIGQLATITGFGVGGVGSQGIANLPALQRAGTNVIDQVFNFANGAQNSALLTDFDGPNGLNNTTGSSAVTTHEYQLATGDSGGGMFIFENGEWKLAGINSGISQAGNSTNELSYGSISVYTRVSSFQPYIDLITAVPEPSSFALAAIGAGALIYAGRRRNTTKS